jgi:hypothetical protein
MLSALLSGAVITVRTLVGHLSGVHPQVLRQMALDAGAVITVCTQKALLTWVRHVTHLHGGRCRRTRSHSPTNGFRLLSDVDR